jgi:hypothetical protein
VCIRTNVVWVSSIITWRGAPGLGSSGAVEDMGKAILRLPERYARKAVAGYNSKEAATVTLGHSVLNGMCNYGYVFVMV